MRTSIPELAVLAALAAFGGCDKGSGPGHGGSGGASSTGGQAAGGSSGNGGTSGTGGSGSIVSSQGGRGADSTGGRSGGGGSIAGGVTTTAGGAGGRVQGGSATGGASGSGGASSTGGRRFDAAPDTQSQPDAATRPDRPAPEDAIEDASTATPPDGPSSSGVYKPPFILGADVTITVEDEYWGATYTDNGQEKSLEQILKDHGFNFIRIDTFVDPGAAGGYAADKPEAFRDLAHTITLAKRVKKIGLGFMLNLHYSDTWTNPSAHATPGIWAGLSLSALATKVHDYTLDAINQLKSQGAMPDMVSVGNEITNGMLWDTGRITNSSFANFATLLKAGVKAVREVDPAIVVVMHIEKCNNFATTKWWLDGVLGEGVSFDVLGQSCYASAPNGVAGYQGTPAEWKSTFTQLASAYPDLKFLIAEYSAQQRAANDVMFGLPDKRGLGSFNWDPTRSYETHPNDPLFSTNGAWNRYVAIPEKMALYEQMAKDFGLASLANR